MASEEVVDLEVAQQKMRKWRDEGYRNSDEIVDLGECLLFDYANKLGDELWVIYEQVCIAACDCNRLELAATCSRALAKKFPSGNRCLKLKAMEREAAQKWSEAEDIYNIMLTDDPANLHIKKRIIAIKKAQGKTEETITALNEYLKEFMGDQEAWMELCELYIRQQDFQRAAFCVEELILCHPHNHLYHQRFAEIHFTIGSPESMEKAKKYFAQALKLDPNNVRALYGLFLASSNLLGGKHPSTTKKKNMQVTEWSAQQVVSMFDVNVTECQKATLTEMFQDMQLSLPTNIPD